jgi:hypothetical protein
MLASWLSLDAIGAEPISPLTSNQGHLGSLQALQPKADFQSEFSLSALADSC